MNKTFSCHSVPGCRAIIDFFHWRGDYHESRNGETVNKPKPRASHSTELVLDKSNKESLSERLSSAEFRNDHDYFLSHFHGDHYSGLSDKWSWKIYCTPTTSKLAQYVLGVRAELFVELEVNKTTVMPTGYKVTAVEANHCPGAVMFIFETVDGRSFLHCGDFRFAQRMKLDPHLLRIANKLDTVYLDTTYAHPKHTFPKQEDSIGKVVTVASQFIAKSANVKTESNDNTSKQKEKTLILIAAYNIGKEKMIEGVASGLGEKVYIENRKAEILACLDDEWNTLRTMITSDPAEACVHVCKMWLVGSTFPYFQPNFKGMAEYRDKMLSEHNAKFDRVLGILPTGWAEASNWNVKKSLCQNKSKDMMTFLVPYSEHSNFLELRDCIGFLRPGRVVPTVFSDKKNSETIARRFNDLINRSNSKTQFMQLFKKAEKKKVTQLKSIKKRPSTSVNEDFVKPAVKDGTSKSISFLETKVKLNPIEQSKGSIGSSNDADCRAKSIQIQNQFTKKPKMVEKRRVGTKGKVKKNQEQTSIIKFFTQK